MDLSNWSQVTAKQIPQQMNGSDCGVFACKFAEYLARRAKLSFTQQNMPYFRQRMIYEIVQNTLILNLGPRPSVIYWLCLPFQKIARQ